jgi:hypothetical protein
MAMGAILIVPTYAWPLSLDVMEVSASVWKDLNDDIKINLQSKKIIQLIEANSAGVIIDAQGIDKSDQGSSGGSNLGAAVGSAMYIDKAISGQNYSAKNQLGAILLGGLVGSMFDKPQIERYHFRYSVRLLNGSIHTQDFITSEAFRKPLGICVRLPDLQPTIDQGLCTQSVESVRKLTISQEISKSDEKLSSTAEVTKNKNQYLNTNESSTKLINCKPKNLAVIRTTPAKCNVINGEIEND